jgi:hypothetical protein
MPTRGLAGFVSGKRHSEFCDDMWSADSQQLS